MKRPLIPVFALLALALALALTPAATARAAGTPAPVTIDPADFVTTVDNPYFPLAPGTTLVYEGTDEETAVRDELTVLAETKTVMGVECTVVHDVAYEDGEVVEETFDWFAQDTEGNVWYFGEDSRAIEDGEVSSTEGSWEAGVDGALPGIVMPASPVMGEPYRQEVAPGVAEDMAMAITSADAVAVPAGTYDRVLVTREWSPLEPGVAEDKLYAPGVGMILSVAIEGGSERLELTEVITPAS